MCSTETRQELKDALATLRQHVVPWLSPAQIAAMDRHANNPAALLRDMGDVASVENWEREVLGGNMACALAWTIKYDTINNVPDKADRQILSDAWNDLDGIYGGGSVSAEEWKLRRV